jgi:type VII secretion-associated serine protease mycosin
VVALVCIGIGVPAQPALADSIRDREWLVSALNLYHAHHLSTGRNVIVAEIDSGVEATHPDLSGNVLVGTDISLGEPHGNGHNDSFGHGTAIASVIAGHGHGPGNRDGILGIAPDAKILPIRNGDALDVHLPEAIDWAIDHHAQVICIAEAGPVRASQMEAAVVRAEQADIVVVAAVGNDPGQTTVDYPAAFPGVVAAAGTDQQGNHAEVSATGPEVVLAAPATNLVEAFINSGYAIGTGTSAATAVIAGAAALVRARFPKLSAVEVIHRLTATAIDKGPPGRDVEYGYGLINIVAALTANVPPLPPSATPTPTTPLTPSATITAAPNPTAHSPTKSSQLPLIATIASVVALLAVLGAWTAARRRSTR